MKQRFLVGFGGALFWWKTLVVVCHWFSGGFTIPQKVRHLRQDLETFLGEEKCLCFMFGFIRTIFLTFRERYHKRE
jgi:hypothetical protein